LIKPASRSPVLRWRGYYACPSFGKMVRITSSRGTHLNWRRIAATSQAMPSPMCAGYRAVGFEAKSHPAEMGD
jgi:hypothetical protein